VRKARPHRPQPRPSTPGLVAYHQEALGLRKINGRITGSKAVLKSKVTGTEPVGVGEPGDGILALEMAADVLNELYGVTGALPDYVGDSPTQP